MKETIVFNTCGILCACVNLTITIFSMFGMHNYYITSFWYWLIWFIGIISLTIARVRDIQNMKKIANTLELLDKRLERLKGDNKNDKI